MKTHVIEIVRWEANEGVADAAMQNAVAGIEPDLRTLPGFGNTTLYKDQKGHWVQLYVWDTAADAEASLGLMSDKPSFGALMALIKADTVTMEVCELP